MKKITVLTTALLLCGPMMAQTNSTYDAQFINWPTYSGDDLELSVNSKGTSFRLWSPKAQDAVVNIYAAASPYRLSP